MDDPDDPISAPSVPPMTSEWVCVPKLAPAAAEALILAKDLLFDRLQFDHLAHHLILAGC